MDPKLYVGGNAAATAGNVVANAELVADSRPIARLLTQNVA